MKKVRKKHELKHSDEILATYKTCKSCKITAYRLKLPYWYVRDMLRYFGYVVSNERPYKPRNPESLELWADMQRNPNNVELGAKYFKLRTTVWEARKLMNRHIAEKKNWDYWIWQFNYDEKEVEEWYSKTKSRKSKK